MQRVLLQEPELGEDDAVIIVDLAETFNKNFPHLHGQIPNEPEQLLLGGLHVPHLGAEEFIALADLAIFLDGVHIDAAEGANPVFELGQAAGGRGHVLGRPDRGLRLAAGELVFLVQAADHVVRLPGRRRTFFLDTGGLEPRLLPFVGLIPRLLAQ